MRNSHGVGGGGGTGGQVLVMYKYEVLPALSIGLYFSHRPDRKSVLCKSVSVFVRGCSIVGSSLDVTG